MKKLFPNSIAVTVNFISLVLFQMRCQKEATAQNSSGYTIVESKSSVAGNKTLLANQSSTSGLQQTGKLSFIRLFETATSQRREIRAENDGNHSTKVNIALLAGHCFYASSSKAVLPVFQRRHQPLFTEKY